MHRQLTVSAGLRHRGSRGAEEHRPSGEADRAAYSTPGSVLLLVAIFTGSGERVKSLVECLSQSELVGVHADEQGPLSYR